MPIQYEPKSKSAPPPNRLLCILSLSYTGGETQYIECIGDTGNVHCSITKKQVNFGLVSVGSHTKDHQYFKNTGENDGFFSIDTISNQEIEIFPMSGIIPAHSCSRLKIIYHPKI